MPIVLWEEDEVISLLVQQIGRSGTSESAVKQAMARVNLIFEIMRKEGPSIGALVTKVKVSALKMRKEVAVRARSMWNVKDMKKLMYSLYRKPADTGSWGSVRTM